MTAACAGPRPIVVVSTHPAAEDGAAAAAGAEGVGGEAEVSTAALADTRWVERRDAGEDAGA